jgi:sulfate transport system ATP-binding protein
MSVVVEHLTRRFSGTTPPAVHDVSFEAPKGMVTALLGPSGSGKTTVLRLIAGLEIPDGGVVRLCGRDMTRVPVQRRGVGFVFQGYALFEHMTVRDNIGFGLSVRRAPRREIDARVDELLALVQLESLGERYPAQLSGGQRQRVAFARALATRPVVLLLDEPFGALDARVRLELRGWLRELHKKVDVTTILVTHDQEEALEIAERVVVMREGGVEQIGTPHEVYDSPRTPFVASFIGNANALRTHEGGVTYVRPHDVKVVRADGAPPVASAEVIGCLRVGAYVKLDLRLPSGEALVVQLPRAEAEALALAPGDRVLVRLGEPVMFTGDYAI